MREDREDQEQDIGWEWKEKLNMGERGKRKEKNVVPMLGLRKENMEGEKGEQI